MFVFIYKYTYVIWLITLDNEAYEENIFLERFTYVSKCVYMSMYMCAFIYMHIYINWLITLDNEAYEENLFLERFRCI
jgi:hypothetical protein